MAKFPVLRKAGMGTDGKLYQFGRINETIPMRGVFIRKDWLEKLHLNIPQTTEEMYQVAKAFTEQDPDGNGKNRPMASHSLITRSLQMKRNVRC